MKLPVGYVPGVGVHKPTAYGGFGEKLLKQLGWREGQGLGADGSGMKRALTVVKKEDNLGVGSRQGVREKDKDWWEQAFNSAVDALKGDDSSTSSDDSEDDESDSPVLLRNRDGTLASGTKEEIRLAQELAKDPWGRFGGRNGKLARIRAQEAAMALKLTGPEGHDAQPEAAGQTATRSKKRKRELIKGQELVTQLSPMSDLDLLSKKTVKEKCSNEGKLADSSQHGNVEKLSSGSKRKHPGAVHRQAELPETVEGCVGTGSEKAAAIAALQTISDAAGQGCAEATCQRAWWGASTFVSRGCLEGLAPKETVEVGGRGFTEDTQADLFNCTQSAKVAGKKGLGSGQGKAVGHEWQGKRVVFHDAGEVDEPDGVVLQHQDNVHHGDYRQGRSAVKQQEPKKRTVKWRKLAKDILLKEANQKMKLSKLVGRLVEELPVGATEASPAEVEAALVSKITGRAGFSVKQRTVRFIKKRITA